jgi:hypothetical protein
MKNLSRSIALIALALIPFTAVFAQTTAPAQKSLTETDPAYHKLDFWVGDWEVYTTGTNDRDGHDRVEKVLNGCAVVEHWVDANGGEGKSWFYYYRPEKRWKQIWVTDVGFIKEKALIEEFPNGGVRFRGEIPLRDGSKILDQTTLTPLPDGTVHQVIETSKDGGKTWTVGFDAIYRRGAKP